MAETIMQLLAARRGHFQMESGYHSELWFNLNRLFEAPEKLQPHVTALTERLKPHALDAVCGPMSGGAKLAAMVAGELGVAAFTAERFEPSAGEGLFRVEYQLPAAQRGKVRGKTIAIVDDAISAGSAVRGTHADLIACGARPVALGALIVFGEAVDGFARDNGLSIEAVSRVAFGMWRPSECPLCAAGASVEEVSDASP